MKITRFILFDDNSNINLLNKIIINRAIDNADIMIFDVPEDGLNYISTENKETPNQPTAVLLDINMSSMSCWDFLSMFDKLEERIKKHYRIYIVSAYITPDDKQRAKENKNVVGYFQKPLTKELVIAISTEDIESGEFSI